MNEAPEQNKHWAERRDGAIGGEEIDVTKDTVHSNMT